MSLVARTASPNGTVSYRVITQQQIIIIIIILTIIVNINTYQNGANYQIVYSIHKLLVCFHNRKKELMGPGFANTDVYYYYTLWHWLALSAAHYDP